MHEYERLEAYQVKKKLKKLEETMRKKIGVSERGLGVEKTDVSRERSREMSCGTWPSTKTRRLYRPSVNLDRCRCREVSSKLSR